MKLKHWLVFIALNIVISAVVTLALLAYWERAHPSRLATPAAGALQGTTTPTPQPPASPIPLQPSPTPSPFPHTIYIVQQGDTLSAISRRFDVSLQDLLVVNALSIDSVLHVGQSIKIPTYEQAAPASTPAPTPTPLPSELSPSSGAVSVEIRQVFGRGDPSREAVTIANLGRPVNLRDWRLSDNEGNVYTFPDLTLWPGGTITLHTGAGPDSVSDLYWKRVAPVWVEPGDVVTLSDAAGSVVARYPLP